MPLLLPLFLAFLIVLPFLELAVMVGVALWLGVLQMLGLLLLSSIVGLLIVRYRTGTHWVQFNEAIRDLRLPTTQAFNGVAVPVGGALLVIPGFITSAMGIMVLLPPTRYIARRITFGLISSQFLLLKVANRLPGPGKTMALWVLKHNFVVSWIKKLMAWGTSSWREANSNGPKATAEAFAGNDAEDSTPVRQLPGGSPAGGAHELLPGAQTETSTLASEPISDEGPRLDDSASSSAPGRE